MAKPTGQAEPGRGADLGRARTQHRTTLMGYLILVYLMVFGYAQLAKPYCASTTHTLPPDSTLAAGYPCGGTPFEEVTYLAMRPVQVYQDYLRLQRQDLWVTASAACVLARLALGLLLPASVQTGWCAWLFTAQRLVAPLTLLALLLSNDQEPSTLSLWFTRSWPVLDCAYVLLFHTGLAAEVIYGVVSFSVSAALAWRVRTAHPHLHFSLQAQLLTCAASTAWILCVQTLRRRAERAEAARERVEAAWERAEAGQDGTEAGAEEGGEQTEASREGAGREMSGAGRDVGEGGAGAGSSGGGGDSGGGSSGSGNGNEDGNGNASVAEGGGGGGGNVISGAATSTILRRHPSVLALLAASATAGAASTLAPAAAAAAAATSRDAAQPASAATTDGIPPPPPPPPPQHQQQQHDQPPQPQGGPEAQPASATASASAVAAAARALARGGLARDPTGGAGALPAWPSRPVYSPRVRLVRRLVKINDAHPEQVTPGYQERMARVVAEAGYELEAVYVRSGCLELVVDARKWGRMGGPAGKAAGEADGGYLMADEAAAAAAAAAATATAAAAAAAAATAIAGEEGTVAGRTVRAAWGSEFGGSSPDGDSVGVSKGRTEAVTGSPSPLPDSRGRGGGFPSASSAWTQGRVRRFVVMDVRQAAAATAAVTAAPYAAAAAAADDGSATASVEITSQPLAALAIRDDTTGNQQLPGSAFWAVGGSPGGDVGDDGGRCDGAAETLTVSQDIDIGALIRALQLVDAEVTLEVTEEVAAIDTAVSVNDATPGVSMHGATAPLPPLLPPVPAATAATAAVNAAAASAPDATGKVEPPRLVAVHPRVLVVPPLQQQQPAAATARRASGGGGAGADVDIPGRNARSRGSDVSAGGCGCGCDDGAPDGVVAGPYRLEVVVRWPEETYAATADTTTFAAAGGGTRAGNPAVADQLELLLRSRGLHLPAHVVAVSAVAVTSSHAPGLPPPPPPPLLMAPWHSSSTADDDVVDGGNDASDGRAVAAAAAASAGVTGGAAAAGPARASNDGGGGGGGGGSGTALQYSLDVTYLPSRPGLLLVEAGGAALVPVVVMRDPVVAGELQAAVDSWYGSADELNDLLHDIASYVHDVSDAETAAAAAGAASVHLPNRLLSLARHLLSFAAQCGLPAFSAQLHSHLAAAAAATAAASVAAAAGPAARDEDAARQHLPSQAVPPRPTGPAAASASPAAGGVSGSGTGSGSSGSRDGDGGGSSGIGSMPHAADAVLPPPPLGPPECWSSSDAFSTHATSWREARAHVMQWLDAMLLLVILCRLCLECADGGDGMAAAATAAITLLGTGGGIACAVAWAALPRSAWLRFVERAALPRQLLSCLSKLLVGLHRWPLLPRLTSYELGLGVWLMEGVVLPGACLLHPPAALLIAAAKVPLLMRSWLAAAGAAQQARLSLLLLQGPSAGSGGGGGGEPNLDPAAAAAAAGAAAVEGAVRCSGGGCSGSDSAVVALVHACGIAALSMSTTLLCHWCMRRGYKRRLHHEAERAKAKQE